MFGTNSIVGKSYFSGQEQGVLLVTSRFWTIQGEGPFAGMPAFFVRLAKCNLDCSFCDTYFDNGTNMTFSDILADLESMALTTLGCALADYKGAWVLVVTGGEPTLQLHNLKGFLARIADELAPYAIQLESNGILYDQELFDQYDIVCSPKVNERSGKYMTPPTEVIANCRALKFVVSADPISPYYNLPDWWHALSVRPITYVSPMNVYLNPPAKTVHDDVENRSMIDEVVSFWQPGLLDMEANQLNHQHAGKLALRLGVRAGVQMHLLLAMA